jgi:hypothetical protein
MKTVRGSQEQVNYNSKIKDQAGKQANRGEEQKTPTQLCSWCENNHRSAITVAYLGISHERVERDPETKEETNRPIKSKRNRQKIYLQLSIQDCNIK